MVIVEEKINIEETLKEILALSAKIATPDHTQDDLIRRMTLIKTLFKV